MAPRVLFEVNDGRGRPIRVFEPSWNHVLRRHKELVNEEAAVRLTISDPDIVVRPSNRPKGRGIDRRANCRIGPHSRYNELYVVVMIDYATTENWLVTAFLSPQPPNGELLFARVPFRWT